MNTSKMTEPLKPELVAMVYSGKLNTCCCGCAGTYSYNPTFQAEASKDRGYEVVAEELNQKAITRIVNLINMHQSEVEVLDDYLFTLELGKRLYMARLPKQVVPTVDESYVEMAAR